MKKIIILLCCLAITLSLYIPAFAAEDIVLNENLFSANNISDISSINKIETQEIFITIPDDYEYSVYKEVDYYYFLDEDYEDSITVICEDKLIAADAADYTDEDIKSVIRKYVLSEAYELEGAKLNIEDSVVEKVNGVPALKITGTYSYKMDEEYTASIVAYIITSLDKIHIIAFDDVDVKFDSYDEVKETMATCAVYNIDPQLGKCTIKNDYENALDFESAVADAYAIYDNSLYEGLDGEYYDDEFFDDESIFGDVDEGFGMMGFAAIGIAILGFAGLCTVALIVAIIILAVSNKKKSKLIKELQEKLNNAYGANVTSYTANTGAYNTQPIPQPNLQPNAQQFKAYNAPSEDTKPE